MLRSETANWQWSTKRTQGVGDGSTDLTRPPRRDYALFEAQSDVREALFFDEGHPDAEGFEVLRAPCGSRQSPLPEPAARRHPEQAFWPTPHCLSR